MTGCHASVTLVAGAVTLAPARTATGHWRPAWTAVAKACVAGTKRRGRATRGGCRHAPACCARIPVGHPSVAPRCHHGHDGGRSLQRGTMGELRLSLTFAATYPATLAAERRCRIRSRRERPIPEDDFVTGLGLVVTTAVGCLMLLSLVFQPGHLMPAVGVVLAGLIVGTIVGEIRRRRESVRRTSKPLPQAPPLELTWNEWLVAAPLGVAWGNRASQNGLRWSTGQPRRTSPTRSARRTTFAPARASKASGHWAGPTAAGQRVA
jgi:hypothetical protein